MPFVYPGHTVKRYLHVRPLPPEADRDAGCIQSAGHRLITYSPYWDLTHSGKGVANCLHMAGREGLTSLLLPPISQMAGAALLAQDWCPTT